MTTETIHILYKVLNVAIAVPFALQLWCFIMCTGYKRAAMNIHSTNREIFRSIKLRYMNSAKLNIPLSDTQSFVTKYLYGQGGPFKFLNNMERLGTFVVSITLLISTALYCRNYMSLTRIIATLAVCICFYLFRNTFSLKEQMRLTVIFTHDYLDNTLNHRVSPEKLRNTRCENDKQIERIAATVTQNSDDALETVGVKKKQPVIKDATASTIIDRIDEKSFNTNTEIIEAVLREYLA